MKPTFMYLLTAVLSTGSLFTNASEPARPAESSSVAEMSLEDLLDLRVSSAGKKDQALSDVAAAAFVITNEMILTSGITTIPELLRLAPGVSVAQIDANKWAISIRGFNSLYSNKLLVMIDGRSVYSPFFSGVHWDVQDLMLEDIDRIEVIRGPGATLWGANAVNGIINIITKHSEDTQNGLLNVAVGTHENGIVSVRYGGAPSPRLHFRNYIKTFSRDTFEKDDANDATDDWRAFKTGFRIDYDHTVRDAIMFSGDIYKGTNGQTNSVPILTAPYVEQQSDDLETRGGNLHAKWNKHYSDQVQTLFQVYAETLVRVDDVFDEEMQIYDIDYQVQIDSYSSHSIVAGANYKLVRDQTKGSFAYSVTPENSDNELFSIFFQDDIYTKNKNFVFTVGAKLEKHDYTQNELQPNVRALWHASEKTSIWAAASRAVRTPSRNDRSSSINFSAFSTGFQPGVVRILGNPDVKPEQLTAYEIGGRSQITPSLNIDIALFHNVYRDLRDTASGPTEFESTPTPAHLVFTQTSNNDASATTTGGELSWQYRPQTKWKLSGAVSILDMEIRSDNSFTASEPGNSPQVQANLINSYALSAKSSLHLNVFRVEALSNRGVPPYTRTDVQFLRQLNPELQVYVVGLNLTDSAHKEFSSVPFTLATEVPRSAHAGLRYRF